MNNDFASEQSIDELLEINDESSEIITESDLKTWSRCQYAFLLKRHMGLSKVPQTAIAAESMIFKNARRALYNIRDPVTGRLFGKQLRVGPQLKTLSELTREELPVYLAFGSPEKFGGAIYGRWMNIKDSFAGKDLVWSSKSQKFFIGKELKIACANYYNFALENLPPIRGYINKDMVAHIEGLDIRVSIPEIRTLNGKELIIDDPTIWGFNAENEYDTKSKIETSNLVTLRMLAISQAIIESEGYARIWNISEETREKISKEIIGSSITYRHFNGLKNEISVAKRTVKDIDNLKKFIERFVKETQSTKVLNLTPNQNYCQGCGANVVNAIGDISCNKVKQGIRTNVPEFYFRKSNQTITIEKHSDKIFINLVVSDSKAGEKQQIENYAIPIEKGQRIVATYYLGIQNSKFTNIADLKSEQLQKGNSLVISSRYQSNIRGIEFEETLIKEMDIQLQTLARESQKEIYHKIEFEKDFKYAGQKSIAKVLFKLGYKNFEKTYSPNIELESKKSKKKSTE